MGADELIEERPEVNHGLAEILGARLTAPVTNDDFATRAVVVHHGGVLDREVVEPVFGILNGVTTRAHDIFDEPIRLIHGNTWVIDERGHIDAGEMAGKRHVTDAREVTDDRPMPMFAGAEAAGYRTQWDAIQTGFVDEPRRAVQEADALVTLVMNRLSEVFTNERTSLERQWGEGDEISTEDLRVALRRYRSFFERLLTL